MATRETVLALKPPDREPSLGVAWRTATQVSVLDVADALEATERPLAKRLKLARSWLKCSIALLRLAPDRLKPLASRLGERLRGFRDELREAGDAQALIASLDDLRSSCEPIARSADRQIIRAWRRRLDARQSISIRALTSERIVVLAGMLRKFAIGLPETGMRGEDDREIVRRFRKDYRRARRLSAKVGRAGGPAGPHRLRRAAVDHRYQLQFLLPAAEDRISDLEKLRRALGAFQDLEMLAAAVRDHPEGDNPRRMLQLIGKRQKKRLRRARRLAARLFRGRSRKVWPDDPVFYGAPGPAPAAEAPV